MRKYIKERATINVSCVVLLTLNSILKKSFFVNIILLIGIMYGTRAAAIWNRGRVGFVNVCLCVYAYCMRMCDYLYAVYIL